MQDVLSGVLRCRKSSFWYCWTNPATLLKKIMMAAILHFDKLTICSKLMSNVSNFLDLCMPNPFITCIQLTYCNVQRGYPSKNNARQFEKLKPESRDVRSAIYVPPSIHQEIVILICISRRSQTSHYCPLREVSHRNFACEIRGQHR